LLSFILLGIPKANGGTRPLAMGESFYVLAASYAVEGAKHAAGQLLGPVQLGVGVPGGAEVAAKLLQALLCAEGDDLVALAGLACDFRNAFNSINRAHVLTELFKHKELNTLWRITHWAYSSPSTLWIRAGNGEILHHLLSTQGVRQGDPLGSLLFAVGVHPVYMETLANQTDTGGVALHDDLTLVGPPEALPPLFSVLEIAAFRIGLVLVPRKCKYLWFHEAPLGEAVSSFVDSNPMSLHTDAVALLGCPLGQDHEAVSACLDAIIDDHVPFFNAIQRADLLGAQVSTTLLAFSGHPRLNYLVRTLNPEIAHTGFARFDDLVLQTAAIVTSSPELIAPPSHVAPNNSHIAHSLFELPVGSGGMGFRKMTKVCIPAFVACIAQAAPFLLQWKQGPVIIATRNTMLCNTFTNCLLSIRMLTNAPPAPIVPSTPPHQISTLLPPDNLLQTALHAYSSDTDLQPATLHLQRTLTRLIEAQSVERLKRNLSHTHYIHLLACSAKWSGIWLRIIPHRQALRMSNLHFSIAFRLRLSLVPIKPPSAPCAGCGALLSTDPLHALHCPTGSEYSTQRHDATNQSLASIARILGASATIEPRTIVYSDDRHPDCSLILGAIERLVDVTIPSPLAPSYSRIAAKVLGVAKAAEARKVSRYAHEIIEQGSLFSPLAIESLGGWGPAACTLARAMADHAENTTHFTRAEALLLFAQTIATAVQRGNATLLLGAYQKARHKLRDD
jgi:hypothetical protein